MHEIGAASPEAILRSRRTEGNSEVICKVCSVEYDKYNVEVNVLKSQHVYVSIVM